MNIIKLNRSLGISEDFSISDETLIDIHVAMRVVRELPFNGHITFYADLGVPDESKKWTEFKVSKDWITVDDIPVLIQGGELL